MSRLGLGWRVALILVAALVILQIAVTAVFYVDRDRVTDAGYRPPFADQVAALVQLLDGAGPAQQALVLRAANGPGSRVTIERMAPADPPGAWHLEVQERLIRQFLGDHGERPLGVIVSGRRLGQGDAGQGATGLGRRLGNLRVRAAVGLASGEVLVVDIGGSLISRVLGIPPGFLASVLGLVVALLALLAVAREMKPLNRLAQAVESFGTGLQPRPMTPEGAREVRALIRAVDAMQRRIATLMNDRSFIVGALAHDLRTYLTRLRLRVELLPDAQRPQAVRDVDEMQVLVEDALTFAKASFAGRAADPVDFAALVRRECDERQAAGAPVTLDLDTGPATVRGSAPALARMVANLIDNAVLYGGRAEVALAVRDGMAELVVDDRGPGIPEAERAAMLEPFRRLEGSRSRDHGGSGLGLAIAQAVAQGMGGRIAIADRAGGGARFTVVLPLAAPDPARPGGPTRPPP